MYSENIIFQNATNTEKIDFKFEVLHKEAMSRKSVFFAIV